MSRPAGSAVRPSAASTIIAARSPYRRGEGTTYADQTICVSNGWRLFLQRGRDKHHGIPARPFRWSRNRADLAACGINEERRRHPRRASDDLQILKNPGAGIGVITELVNADIPEPLAWLVGIAGIYIDCDHFEARPAELLLERVQRRHFLAA